MGSLRKLVCATAFLDMVLSTLSIPCRASIATISLRQAFIDQTWTLVPIFVFMWAKAIIAYYTLKSCVDLISTTLRSCKCHSLEENKKRAKRWRNLNVANLVLSSPVAFIALMFLLPVEYYDFIVTLSPIEFLLCLFITIISCLHARKISKRMKTDLEHNTVQNTFKEKSRKPDFMYKNWTCLFAFVETSLNGMKVMVFGLTALYLVLSGAVKENQYQEIIKDIIEPSLGLYIQIPWYTLSAIWTVLFLLVPLGGLYLAIRTVAVTIHVCPEVSLSTTFARISQFRNWTCFVLLLNAVHFTTLIALGSDYLAIGLLVIEFIMRFGFLFKLWFHVNETKAHVENAKNNRLASKVGTGAKIEDFKKRSSKIQP